ncbi:hypothetical protein NKH77_17480 [Streptomyces sp. M19]
MAWSEQEKVNILPAVRAAEAAGMDGHAWRLAAVWENGQPPSAPAAEWLPIGQIGLSAVRRVGDRAGRPGSSTAWESATGGSTSPRGA